MKLTDLIAKVTGLEQRATEAFKAEVAELKNTVVVTLANLKTELQTALDSVASLTKEKVDIQSQVSELTNKLSESNKEFLGFNEALSNACLNGGLLDLKLAADATDEQKKSAAMAVPIADKFKLYQGALNAAFAKAGIPNSTLPTPPAAATISAAQAGARKMKMSEFRALSPKSQSDFCAAVRKGEAVLEMD